MTKILATGTLTLATVLVSLAVSSSATAAENGHVPADQLAQLGLAPMDVLSDNEGNDIRGNGFFFLGYAHHHYLHGRHGKLGPFFFGHHGHGKHHHGHGSHGKHGYGSHGHHGHPHTYLTSGGGFRHFLHVISHGHGGHKRK